MLRKRDGMGGASMDGLRGEELSKYSSDGRMDSDDSKDRAYSAVLLPSPTPTFMSTAAAASGSDSPSQARSFGHAQSFGLGTSGGSGSIRGGVLSSGDIRGCSVTSAGGGSGGGGGS